MLLEHMKEGLSYETFSAVIDVNLDTLYEWERKHPEFSETKKRAREFQKLFWQRLGRAAAAGKVPDFNATAFIWMTKNLIGWRDKHDVEVKQHTQITIESNPQVLMLSDEELIQVAAKHFAVNPPLPMQAEVSQLPLEGKEEPND